MRRCWKSCALKGKPLSRRALQNFGSGCRRESITKSRKRFGHLDSCSHRTGKLWRRQGTIDGPRA